MPIVQVQVWQGIGEERARRLIEGITASFEGIGVPASAVQVVIQEIPRTHWGIGGQVSADERPARPSGYREQRDDRGQRPPRQDRSSGYRSRGEERREPSGRSWRDERSRGQSGAGRSEQSERPARRPRPDSRPGSRPRRGGSGGQSSSRS